MARLTDKAPLPIPAASPSYPVHPPSTYRLTHSHHYFSTTTTITSSAKRTQDSIPAFVCSLPLLLHLRPLNHQSLSNFRHSLRLPFRAFPTLSPHHNNKLVKPTNQQPQRALQPNLSKQSRKFITLRSNPASICIYSIAVKLLPDGFGVSLLTIFSWFGRYEEQE